MCTILRKFSSQIIANSLKLGNKNYIYSTIPILENQHIRTFSNDIPVFDMENPFEKEKQQCILCKYNVKVDYKNVKLLSQFQSPYTGRVYGKHITGLCTQQHELVEKEIMKAQSAGLMATYLKEPCYLEDPLLFDVNKPVRPHRY